MAKKFKLVDEPYTRTILKKEGDKVVAENKEFDVQDSIKALDINISYKFSYIPLDKIMPNPKNEAYREITSEADVRMLADSIAAYGMGTNLVLRKLPEKGMYMLISGESRTRALNLLLSEGFNIFPNGVPANVIEGELSADDESILIDIYNIMSRRYQPEKYISLVAEFEKRLMKSAKRNGEKLSNINRLIANLAGISERMAKRIRSYNTNLIPELLNALKENKIGQRDADVYTRISDEEQKLVAKYLEQDKVLNLDEIVSIREAELDLLKDDSEAAEEVSNTSATELISETSNIPDGIKVAEVEIGELQITKEVHITKSKPTLENPAVKKRVIERELDKLSKNIKRMISEFMTKEYEYRNTYDGDKDKYEALAEILKNVVVDGDK